MSEAPDRAAPMYRITVEDAVSGATRAERRDPPATYDICRRETLVGREPHCDLRLDEPFVSRRHARLLLRRTHLHLDDLGSTNATRLNGDRVETRMSLKPGDQVQFGPVHCRIESPQSRKSPESGRPGRGRLPPRPSRAAQRAATRRDLSAAPCEPEPPTVAEPPPAPAAPGPAAATNPWTAVPSGSPEDRGAAAPQSGGENGEGPRPPAADPLPKPERSPAESSGESPARPVPRSVLIAVAAAVAFGTLLLMLLAWLLLR